MKSGKIKNFDELCEYLGVNRERGQEILQDTIDKRKESEVWSDFIDKLGLKGVSDEYIIKAFVFGRMYERANSGVMQMAKKLLGNDPKDMMRMIKENKEIDEWR